MASYFGMTPKTKNPSAMAMMKGFYFESESHNFIARYLTHEGIIYALSITKKGEPMADSVTTQRLKAMIAAFEAGKFQLPNQNSKKKLNFDDIPDDITVYAGEIPSDKQNREG